MILVMLNQWWMCKIWKSKENLYNKKNVGRLWQEKVGRLISESVFVVLDYVIWRIRNIVWNLCFVCLSRKNSNYSLFTTKFKSYKSGFFQMYVTRKFF